MKKIAIMALALGLIQQASAQNPTYQLILKNDALVSSTAYEFDLYIQRTGVITFELAQIQPILSFNTAISGGTITYTVDAGTSGLVASEQPSNANLSVSGNELRMFPASPPGAGNGTIVPTSPGVRVGRFRVTSSVPFANQQANIAWVNATNPFTKVFAYVGGVNVDITDSTGHLNSLTNPTLSPVGITTTSPLPSGVSGTPYADTLKATGGTPPYSWSLISGALPLGMSLSAQGIISGVPTIPATYTIGVQVTDSLLATASKSFSLVINAGAPTQLVFAQQPGNAVAGAVISPPVTVRLKDALNNNVAAAGVSVSIALTAGSTGTLSGTTARLTDSTGVATFNDLSINRPGTKKLLATSNGLTSATSDSFAISTGPPSQLVFATQPSNSLAGSPILPPVAVQIEDGAGNPLSIPGDTVRMALATGTGALSGSVTQLTAPNGVATFSNLSINLTGSKTLIASSTGLTPATSQSFNITSNAAKKLVFVQQPTTSASNTVISPAVTVQLQDSAGNNVPFSGDTVRMAISSGSGVLSGTRSQLTDVNGLATFNDLRIDTAGLKQLTAAGTGLTPAISNAFSINPGTASRLAFIQQPQNDTAGSILSPPITVQVEDGAGNFVSVSGDSITMFLTAGIPGHLTGTLTRGTSALGLATFNDLRIDSPGTKSLTASAVGLSAATSSPFTLSTLTITAIAGLNGSISPSGAVPEIYGASQLFTFTPNQGYHVGSVSVDGSPVGAPASYTFSNIIANHTISVAFAPDTLAITVQSSPSGRALTVDGTRYASSPQSFNWVAGSNHTISINGDTIQSGGTGIQYKWTSWSDGGANSHAVVPLVNTTYTANFVTQYFLTMVANAGGSVLPPSNWFNAGSPVTIIAIPAAHFSFGRWSGTGTGSTSSFSDTAGITMGSPITETASFTQNPFNMTVQTNPPGRSFTVNGTTYTTTQTFQVSSGSSWPISTTSIQPAGAGAQYAWRTWSDGGTQSHLVTIFSDTTFTANFAKQFLLTTVAGLNGSVTPPSAYVDSGKVDTLTATPNVGYAFAGWKGSGPGSYSGPNNPALVTMGGPINDTATFTQYPVHVTMQTVPSGLIYTVDGVRDSVTKIYTWSSGTSHTISVPDSQLSGAGTRQLWYAWSDGGAKSHVVAPLRDTTFTGTFGAQYMLGMNAGIGGTVSPASNWYDGQSIVPISATPNSGYTFSSWTGSGPGSYTGTTRLANVTVNGPISQTANFVVVIAHVTVSTNPPGRSYIVDSVTYSTPQTFSWLAGSNHSVGTTTPQAGTAGTQYLWQNWSDGGAINHTVTALLDTSLVANFKTQYFLTMVGDSTGSVSPPSGYQDSGKSVMITATPNTGYSFSAWSGTGTGSFTGSNNPANVTMSSPITETASFSRFSANVTVQTVPSGRAITVDGTGYTSPQTFSWMTGSTHTIATSTPQAGGTGTRYVWTSWSDGGTISHTVVPHKDTTFTASFTTQYSLTMNANAGGTVLPASGWFNAAQVVTIIAFPNPGYSFSRWTGTGTGSSSSFTDTSSVTMNSPITETASFNRNNVVLTIQTSPAGMPFNVDGGQTYYTTQSFSVQPNTSYTINAISPFPGTAGMQSVWTNWSDGGAQSHQITVLGDTTFTAFYKKQYYLTLAAGTGGSVVQSNGWQDSGSVVTITATPSTGYTFAGWIGTGPGSYSGPNNPAQVTMNGPIGDTATFTRFPIHVTVQSNPPGRTFMIDGATDTNSVIVVWTSGSSHTLAVADTQDTGTGSRWLWASWSDNGAKSHSVAPTKDTTFTINFNPQYFLTTSAQTGGTAAPPSGWYNPSQTVTITATALTGYTFNAWNGTGSGSYSGPSNPAQVTMSGPVSETATFARFSARVTLQTIPSGLTVIADGSTYTSPHTFIWTTGSSHTIGTTTPQAGTTGTQYLWSSWNDGGAMSHTIIPLVDTTVTAAFTTQYYLTMNANAGGSVSPASNWYNSGQGVTITANPDTSFSFSVWAGTGSGSYSGFTNPSTVTMNSPITETASFRHNQVHITVRTNPVGLGFYYDYTLYTTTQTFTADYSSQHNLDVLSPQAGTVSGTQYAWQSWSDGGAKAHTIYANSDSTFTANLVLQNALTVDVIPAAGGTTNPTGMTYYTTGDTAVISAIPASGYAFSNWTGAASGSSNPVSVIMNAPKTVHANFVSGLHVTLLSNPAGRTILADGSAYRTPAMLNWAINSTHTIAAASPQSGDTLTRYTWKAWSDSGAVSHSVSPSRDTSFTATFATQFYLTMGSSGSGTVSPSSGWYDSTHQLTINATPASGYQLNGWNGTGAGSYSGYNDSARITISNPISETAIFGRILTPVTLTGLSDDTTGVTTSPTLSWMAYSGATAYEVQISTDSTFASVAQTAVDTVVPSSSTSLTVDGLGNFLAYFWRVRAKVGTDYSKFPVARRFTTMTATITLIQPAVGWATGYTYAVHWSSSSLSGAVNIKLSLDGGLSFRTLASGAANTGSLTMPIPDTMTLSNACLLRVESTLNPALFDQSALFSIVSGALPLSVPMSTSIPFPAAPSASTDYRLISGPGIVDSLRFGLFLSGTQKVDWRIFADNGQPDNYLVELDLSSSLATGEGYWLLKKGNLDIPTFNMVMPRLSQDATRSIVLHSGWNIIANPFNKNVPWQAVLDANNLPASTSLWGYAGSYASSLAMTPFQGYYFDNTTGLSTLKIPYPFGTSAAAPRQPAPWASGPDAWRVQISLKTDLNSDPENYIGIAPEAGAGSAMLNQHKPPLFLDQGFLYFPRPEWDKKYTRYSSDFRPSLGEGQVWTFEVTDPHLSKGVLTFAGIDKVPAEDEVMLVNLANSAPVDLRQQNSVTFQSTSPTMPFKIIVGTKAFVQGEIARNIPQTYDLAQNYPNPFNMTTSIRVQLPQASEIRLEVYSILGQRVKTIADGSYPSGVHTFVWDGTDGTGRTVASGVYLYRLSKRGELVQVKKMILTK